MDACLIISVRTWLLVPHGNCVQPHPILLVVHLSVDGGHIGAGQDEADDAEQGEGDAAANEGEQERGDVAVEPLLHHRETAMGEDLLVGADVSEDVGVLYPAAG